MNFLDDFPKIATLVALFVQYRLHQIRFYFSGILVLQDNQKISIIRHATCCRYWMWICYTAR